MSCPESTRDFNFNQVWILQENDPVVKILALKLFKNDVLYLSMISDALSTLFGGKSNGVSLKLKIE